MTSLNSHLMEKNQLLNQHLIWRAGFGPAAGQLPELSRYKPKDFFNILKKASTIVPTPLDVATPEMKQEMYDMKAGKKDVTNAEERKKRQQLNREGVRNLNLSWMDAMIHSPAQLREKMAFFWHGHFACRTLNFVQNQQLINLIRTHALGDFGMLLREVSRSGAMINFLNNQQNKKDHPNENFARELMELFTLGRGHYMEEDVKEAARSFTGWSAQPTGEFLFRRAFHDTGAKTILGKTGNFKGEDVLQILLQQKQTARHITKKLWRFLVSESIDEARIDKLAEGFFQSGYQIMPLLEAMFLGDGFFDKKNMGSLIKSPVELIVGIRRMIPMELKREESILLLQRAMGQVLFYPPNVAGWPGGKNWIDSSSLMLRMRLPLLLSNADEFNVGAKDDDDMMMGMGKRREGMMQQMVLTSKWDEVFSAFADTRREQLPSAIQACLLQLPVGANQAVITRFSDNRSRESFIRSHMLHVMSMPEYQLC